MSPDNKHNTVGIWKMVFNKEHLTDQQFLDWIGAIDRLVQQLERDYGVDIVTGRLAEIVSGKKRPWLSSAQEEQRTDPQQHQETQIPISPPNRR